MGVLGRFLGKQSFRNIMLFAAIPALIVGIVGSSILSFYFVSERVKEIVEENAVNTVSQAAQQLEVSLLDVFTEFVLTEKAMDFNRLAKSGGARLDDESYMELYDRLSRTYLRYSKLLDFVYVGFEYGDGETYKISSGNTMLKRVPISFDESIGGVSISSERARKYVWGVGGAGSDEGAKSGLSLFKVIYNKKTDTKCLLYFKFRADLFEDDLFEEIGEDMYYMVLVDQNGQVFSPSAQINAKLREMELIVPSGLPDKGVIRLSIQKEQYLLVYESIRLCQWKYAAIINESQLFSFSATLFDIFKWVSIVVLLFVLLFSGLSTMLITRPVNRWVDKIKTIKGDQFDVLLEEDMGCRELAQINDGILYMQERVNGLLSDMKKAYERKRSLEFKLLQEKINPHFLYNSLYSIQELYNMGETENASRMMQSLTDFFRLCHSDGNEHVPIRTELHLVREYLKIQQMRHENFTFDIVVPLEVLECFIFKLALQPIVENMVSHGIYGVADGKIVISGSTQGEDIVIEVSDNGSGVPAQRLALLQDCLNSSEWEALPGAYGLRNVHERTQLYYGQGRGLWIESEDGKGTVVLLRIRRDESAPCE